MSVSKEKKTKCRFLLRLKGWQPSWTVGELMSHLLVQSFLHVIGNNRKLGKKEKEKNKIMQRIL